MSVYELIKYILSIVPFCVLCMSTRKVNLNRVNRGQQFLMPIITVVYCIVAMILMNQINVWLVQLINLIGRFIPFIKTINISQYLIFIFNTVAVVAFLAIKGIALPILKGIWGGSNELMEATSGIFYEYEDDVDKWFVKKEYGQVKTFYNVIYYIALAISVLILVLTKAFPDVAFFRTPFYPVFGILILGEVVNLLSGMTKVEFIEDILGEDEESFKIANYGLLRGVLKDLFGSRVLYDATVDASFDIPSEFETIEQMMESEDENVRNLGKYFKLLREHGEVIDSNYVKSSVNLVKGQSVLFCNPFYRDLTGYIILPMLFNLMKYKKCLIVVGRDSAADDVKDWIEQGIIDCVKTDSLWKVGMLNTETTEADIGIIKFSDLYNLEIHKNNSEFLSRVGFVFLVEPSHILATGQMGLSLLVSRFTENKNAVVYSACDRNCDGLVDALSHTLKTNITGVTATLHNEATTSLMCWNADGPYMHHKIYTGISRYLGIGTEINSVAMKYQIANTKWISSEKFPVFDMKWIAGQYYKKICAYANLPVSQQSFNDAFQVEANLWNVNVNKNAFLVVEDEFQNLFEMARVYATRAEQQMFLNLISENYLLREYMIDNVQTFMSDPKAIPTIIADYVRTERNTVLKLLMRMSEEQISEDEIKDIFMVSDIKFDNVLDTLKALIRKHCFMDKINIRIYFREEMIEDALRSEVKKYYTIEEDTEIAEYTQNLKNAYYIAEDEKGEINYIGAKLYGHVFQALIPGQFITYAGKYYEVQSITPCNGVVLRRAADHINERKYYRQIRNIDISGWNSDTSVGGQKDVDGVQIEKGYCQIKVSTEGYLEMSSYENFKDAKVVKVNAIPDRLYRNKLVLKINFPEISETVRYMICLLLNEVFKTTYPDSYQYICAVTPNSVMKDEETSLKHLLYSIQSDVDENSIYIVEDSEIDLGLIVSVERNLERYLGIITDVLKWHETKMQEKPEQEEPKEYVPEFEAEPEEKKTFIGKIKGKIKSFWEKLTSKFKKKKGKKDAEQPAQVEETEQIEQPAPAEEAVQPTPTESPEEAKEQEQPEETAAEAKAETSGTPLRDSAPGMSEEEIPLDVEGEDEELADGTEEMTEYQKHCYLKFGFEDFSDKLDFAETIAYMTKLGYAHNPLQQVREGEDGVEETDQKYDPHKMGAHFCDFCGVELVGGEYELLKDGRERCNRCSSTALRTGEEFKEIYKKVLRNMEIFYGIKLNVAIKVRMTDAKKIAKHFGEKFVATPGFDGRTLGFAQKDSTGYSIYIENSSPKLAAMATLAHELTHIWQYLNWDDKEIVKKYGKQNRLEIYEGMAKWAEIQYLLYLNETSYAKRQEVVTRRRNDPYGRGFIKYAEKYSLSYDQSKKKTPFQENPPL